MKKFDNHVTKLQREMMDITNNLNKFRNKNHKTISLIINNLNSLSKEIANNNIENDSNVSNKNSQIEDSRNSINNEKEIKNYYHYSLPKYHDVDERNKKNALFSEKNNDYYRTFFINNKSNSVNKRSNGKNKTPRKQYFRADNFQFNNKNNDYFNEFFNNKLKADESKQNFNKNSNKNKNKKINKNNVISITQDHKIEDSTNKKKNNTITNLLFNNNNKKEFIYFNRNKQNYFRQYNLQKNSNKVLTSYYSQRNKENKSYANMKKINTFHERIDNNESQEDNKNNSFNESNYYDLNNNTEEDTSQKHESEIEENIEINRLLELLKLKNNNDLKMKLKELYMTKIFANKIISLFYKNNKNKKKNAINFDDVLCWILSMSNYNKENEEYKLYCKKIMKNYNIKSFNHFKVFIDKILNKNIQNINFIGGVKKILSTNIDDNSEFKFIDTN